MDDISEGYSGSDSYKHVEPILSDRGRELLVITPYLSIGYAKRLVKLGHRKRVRVITSASSTGAADYIGHHSKHVVYGYAKTGTVFGLGAIVATYFSLYQIALYAIGLVALVCGVGYLMYKHSKNSNIEVRIPYGKFVHEKAYISDSVAAVGSANLTYSGMHKNVERVEVIREPRRIDSLRSHFSALWREAG